MKLSKVTCEYLIKNGDCRPTEDVKAEWGDYSNIEQKGWFTTRCERLKPNARDVLDDIIEQMADVGYEEMDVALNNSISEDDVNKLQSTLDEMIHQLLMFIIQIRRLQMIEDKQHKLQITMKSGREYSFMVSNTELDWLYDRLFGRSDETFQNFSSDEIINVSEIEYLKHEEVADD